MFDYGIVQCKQLLPRVIWVEGVALVQLRNIVPIGYNGTPQTDSPQNCSFRFDDHHRHLINTPIPRPTPLTTPNGIRIRSAVLAQYIFRPDRPTDRPTDGIGYKCVPRALTLLTLSDALIINAFHVFQKTRIRIAKTNLTQWIQMTIPRYDVVIIFLSRDAPVKTIARRYTMAEVFLKSTVLVFPCGTFVVKNSVLGNIIRHRRSTISSAVNTHFNLRTSPVFPFHFHF